MPAITFEFHPAANLFPLMEGDEFDSLCESIRTEGLKLPILMHEERIIDGRNRYRACRQTGVEPRFKSAEVTESPEAFVAALNLERRHLTTKQRALIAAEIKKRLAARAKEKQREHAKTAPGKKKTLAANLPQVKERAPEARAQAAKAMKVSPRLVDAASRVLEKGTPELVEAVKSGKVGVSTAAKLALLPPEHQKIVAVQPAKEMRQAAKETKPKKISEVFYESLRGLLARASGIRDQYGSVTEMLNSPLWADQDIYFVVEMVHELSKTFVQWDKEMQDYAKRNGYKKNGQA